jgi:hypothetical protein
MMLGAFVVVASIALVILAAALSACTTPTPTSSTLPPLERPPSLAGKSAEERLQTLQALSRTSKATIYFPGDPYAGMSIVNIDTDSLAGKGAYAMSIHYATESSDRSLTVTIYTPEQYAQSSAAHSHEARSTVTLRSDSSGTVFKLSGDPAPVELVAKRPGAVVVVRGDPEMTASQLSDVATQLMPVER